MHEGTNEIPSVPVRETSEFREILGICNQVLVRLRGQAMFLEVFLERLEGPPPENPLRPKPLDVSEAAFLPGLRTILDQALDMLNRIDDLHIRLDKY